MLESAEFMTGLVEMGVETGKFILQRQHLGPSEEPVLSR